MKYTAHGTMMYSYLKRERLIVPADVFLTRYGDVPPSVCSEVLLSHTSFAWMMAATLS